MILKKSHHFEDRMQDRSVDIDHVKFAIKHPDDIECQKGGNFKVTKTIGEKTIVVVYLKEQFRDKKESLILITAYYLT